MKTKNVSVILSNIQENIGNYEILLKINDDDFKIGYSNKKINEVLAITTLLATSIILYEKITDKLDKELTKDIIKNYIELLKIQTKE